jgi:hypothetical protein
MIGEIQIFLPRSLDEANICIAEGTIVEGKPTVTFKEIE